MSINRYMLDLVAPRICGNFEMWLWHVGGRVAVRVAVAGVAVGEGGVCSGRSGLAAGSGCGTGSGSGSGSWNDTGSGSGSGSGRVAVAVGQRLPLPLVLRDRFGHRLSHAVVASDLLVRVSKCGNGSGFGCTGSGFSCTGSGSDCTGSGWRCTGSGMLAAEGLAATLTGTTL
jgi:hypothetical protein